MQDRIGDVKMPSTLANFEGGNNTDSIYPPDTNGDIGYDPASGKRYYMQMINLHYQIWDVSEPANPISVLGPLENNTLWSGFGGVCETSNIGDPVALFDEQSHRWLASQFVVPGTNSHQCIAISQTADPTGVWYRYDFLTSASLFIDYPHFGVWPDATYNAYYMTAHEFSAAGTAYLGQATYAFEGGKMLNDQAAQMVSFDLGPVNLSFGGQLPADLDGPPPQAGTPGYFFEVDDSGAVTDTLSIWEFRPDWTPAANSTFGLAGLPNTILSIDNFITFAGGIPQPGTSQTLDSLADRLMQRVAFRNFGSYQSMVLNHTVDDGTGRAGINWIEVRNNGGTWSVNQQGVYAPANGIYRWMGSIAQDVQGNMALGFSVSNGTSVYPSIRYTGRQAGDPPNTLPQAEATIVNGSGNQTGPAGRWGDYSMLGVDPQDGCTFWYTQEYIQTSGSANWQTRIASIKFPGCGVVGTNHTYLPIVQRAAPVSVDWTPIMQEGFEGVWPSTGWNVTDAGSQTYYWAKRNCHAASGSFGAWAMGGGSLGSGLNCGAHYIDNAQSWMVYGPFSLAGATAAEFNLQLWLNSELSADGACLMASTDGSSFSGTCYSGSTAGSFLPVSIDLSNVRGLGSLLGQPNAWVAVIFQSDGGVNLPEGAFVDDLLLRKCTVASCPSLPSGQASTNNGQLQSHPASLTRPANVTATGPATR